MTDEQHPHEPEQDAPAPIDPAVEERIRALLAEQGSAAGSAAGSGEAIPAEVAARLEDTLALLVAERPAAGTVVPLRRRWAPRTLVAAVAVVVVGLGGAAIAGLGGLDGAAQDETAGGSTADKSTVESQPAPESGGDLLSPSPGVGAELDSATTDLAPLSSATFARDVRRLVASGRLADTRSLRRGSASASPSPLPGATACPGPARGPRAVSSPVTLDGTVVALVVEPIRAGSRRVEAWSCDGATRLATTMLSP